MIKKISIVVSKISEGYNIISNNKRIAGQLVPHLHFHIIPRYKDDGHKFGWQTTKYKEGEEKQMAEKIKSLL